MAQVAPSDEPLHTERWNIPFYEVPEIMPNCTYTEWAPGSKAREYGRVLDTVFEKADDLATGNLETIDSAIDRVIRDHGWRLLPKHKRLLATIWRQPDDGIPVRLETPINPRGLYRVVTKRAASGNEFEIEVKAGSKPAARRLALANGYRVIQIGQIA